MVDLAAGSDLFVYIKGSTFPDRPDAGPGWVPVCVGLVPPEGKKVWLASRAELIMLLMARRGAMDWPPTAVWRRSGGTATVAACAWHAAGPPVVFVLPGAVAAAGPGKLEK